jgi:hypothetical protein
VSFYLVYLNKKEHTHNSCLALILFLNKDKFLVFKVETLEKEKQPPDRDLSRKLDEVSAKRATQKEVVFQKEMEAREIGKTPGGWQRFLV